MIDKPLITIIIPIYNCEDYIEECIESILNQSIGQENLEIIAIDDCSPCESFKILKEKYSPRYSNITLLKNDKNLGPGGTRNVGIKSATSDLITFIDGDDWYHINYCKALYENFSQHRADITVCGMINTIDGVKARWGCTPPRGIYFGDDKLDLLFSKKIECHSPYRLYKKSLFIENSLWFNENMLYEDTALMPKLFYHAVSISCIEDTLYYYRFNSESIVNTSSIKHITDINLAWNDILSAIPINLSGINFFWWLNAHNIFRKREELLNKISITELYDFLGGFFNILNTYPVLIHGFIINQDIKDIIKVLKSLNQKHNNLLKTNFDFTCFDYLKESKETKGLVSVIMPAFNTDEYILNAIKSVLSQTYEKLELIIINDASTDGTRKILNSINDTRVKIINLPTNSGAYYSRNIGVFLSKGEFVTTVDSDDIISPERIQKLVDLANKTPQIKLIETRFTRFKRNGKLDFRLFTQGVGNGFFRKEVVNDLGYFLPVKGGGDSEYSHRIQSYYGKTSLHITNDFTYWAGIRDESLTAINLQGSISREEFNQFYKKNKINYVDFPWRKNSEIINKVLQLEIGQKDFNTNLQHIKIYQGKKDLIFEKTQLNSFYLFSNQGMSYYYSKFIEHKNYAQKLESKLNKLQNNPQEENIQKLDYDQLEKTQNHYNNVYEKMPLWWKKLGALIRKIRK